MSGSIVDDAVAVTQLITDGFHFLYIFPAHNTRPRRIRIIDPPNFFQITGNAILLCNLVQKLLNHMFEIRLLNAFFGECANLNLSFHQLRYKLIGVRRDIQLAHHTGHIRSKSPDLLIKHGDKTGCCNQCILPVVHRSGRIRSLPVETDRIASDSGQVFDQADLHIFAVQNRSLFHMHFHKIFDGFRRTLCRFQIRNQSVLLHGLQLCLSKAVLHRLQLSHRHGAHHRA